MNKVLPYSTGNSIQCSMVTKWEGNPKKGICVYVWLIHFAVQQKLTQHYNAKKNLKLEIYDSSVDYIPANMIKIILYLSQI